MDSAVEKGHLDGGSERVRAHKYGFGGVSKQLNYILLLPNGPPPPHYPLPVEAKSNSVLQYVMGAS